MKWLFLLLTSSFILKTIAQQPQLVLLIGHTQYVNSAEFSPDGNYVVTTLWLAKAHVSQ